MSDLQLRNVARKGLEPWVGDIPASPNWTEVTNAPLTTRQRSRPSRLAMFAAAAVVLVGLLAVGLFTAVDEPPAVTTPPVMAPSTTGTQATSTTPPAAREPFTTHSEVMADLGWLMVELPQQVTTGNGIMTHTDDEIIFWGGQNLLDQPDGDPGVAYSVSTNTWRELPPSPKPAASLSAAVWTGSEVIIGYGESESPGTVAAYNPSTDSWRSIAGSPLNAGPGTAVWTGEEVIMAAGETVAAYNPGTDRWREFPRDRTAVPGTLGRLKEVAWTGSEVIFWRSDVTRRTFPGYALDPETGSWRILPEPPVWPAVPDIAWTGEELILWGGLPGEHEGDPNTAVGAIYNPRTDKWTEMSESLPEPIPHEGVLGSQTTLWTGSELLVSTGFLASGLSEMPLLLSYDPSTDVWAMIGPSPVNGYNASAAVMADDRAVLRWDAWIFVSPNRPWATRPMPLTDATGEFLPRRDHVSVWTGAEVLIYGGCCDLVNGGALATGLAWNPSTRVWRDLPESPLALDFWWRSPIVWTGTEMAVSGRLDGYSPPSLQLYSPQQDRWRVAPPRPTNDMAIGGMVWTGTDILFVGGDHLYPYARAWAYNPALDTWRELPEPGIPEVEYIEGVWTGTEAVFFHGGGLNFSGGTIAYNPATDSWRHLTDIGDSHEHGFEISGLAWTGTRVLLYDGRNAPGTGVGDRLLIFDPATDSWIFSSPIPITPRVAQALTWTGNDLIVWGGAANNAGNPDTDGDYIFGDGAMYNAATDSWTVLPPGPLSDRCYHSGTWTGNEFVLFGGWTNCMQIDSWGVEQAAAYHLGRREWTLLTRD